MTESVMKTLRRSFGFQTSEGAGIVCLLDGNSNYIHFIILYLIIFIFLYTVFYSIIRKQYG